MTRRGTPIARLVRAATDHLRAAGVDAPRLDAQILLATALGVRRFDLVIDPPTTMPSAARTRFFELVRARARHEPVAYLVGKKEFLGRDFHVDRRVLVPRPETELLAELAIAWLRERSAPGSRVLDLCCGSGCVGISIAAEVAGAAVVATDISRSALDVAAINVAALVPGRVELRLGDLWDAVSGDGEFDLVVANPPYVPDSEGHLVERGVRDFEPSGAWSSGTDALVFHERILRGRQRFVSAGGAIMMEVGSGAHELAEKCRGAAPDARVSVHDDLAGHPRVVVVV